ncbi:transcriptional repressor [Oceanispirochaeta crateris]|uniref:Fur family transcriptional regulator n=1 Tax=Oceanispirochaeta crateris TaxID=2518645 RepID=UPI00143D1CAD
MTNKRQAILDLIQNSSQPLNPGQIFEDVKSKMNLTTVYRGLQYLEEEKYISSFVFYCENRGMERYYASKNLAHAHYMHCRKCHSFFPVSYCPLDNTFKQQKEINGFLVEEHTISFKGLCKSCR